MVKELDLKEIKDKIFILYDLIKNIYSVKKIILYGSYAKGNINKYSDIDIGVIIENKGNLNRVDVTSNLFHYSRKIDVNIEPKCIFIDEYDNCDNASILFEIKKTAINVI
jgi:predicted nucleotidyltransferase